MSDDLPVLNYEDFVRVRKLHWMKEARNLGSDVAIPPSGQVDLNESDSDFIISAPSPQGVFGVFEDDGDVGWFYLFRLNEQRILKCTHVYNRTNVSVDCDNVNVIWSSDYETCGIAIWAQMRAFLGISNGIEMRQPLSSKDAPGFHVGHWPSGFGQLLAKDVVQ